MLYLPGYCIHRLHYFDFWIFGFWTSLAAFPKNITSGMETSKMSPITFVCITSWKRLNNLQYIILIHVQNFLFPFALQIPSTECILTVVRKFLAQILYKYLKQIILGFPYSFGYEAQTKSGFVFHSLSKVEEWKELASKDNPIAVSSSTVTPFQACKYSVLLFWYNTMISFWWLVCCLHI